MKIIIKVSIFIIILSSCKSYKIVQAPIFPGCDKGKTEELRKWCFQKKISRHVGRNFNTDLANELGLDSGKKRIITKFNNDKNGNIINIIARAPHSRLKKEAIRIIKILPKMIPGKAGRKSIVVEYSYPITFIV